MAKMMIFILSLGTDFITMALVPFRQFALTCVARSLPEGFAYTLWEYSAAIHSMGNVSMYLEAHLALLRSGAGSLTVSKEVSGVAAWSWRRDWPFQSNLCW